MAFTLQFDRTTSAVVITATGDGDLEEGIRAFREAADFARSHGAERFLIDILELRFVPTATEADAFAEELAKLGREGKRFAIVAPPGVAYGVARMVGTLSDMRGASVEAFDVKSEAQMWLAGAHRPAGGE